MMDSTKSILNLKTVDHIAVVVKDARKTAGTMEAMLGIGPWAYHTWGSDTSKTQGIIAYAYWDNGVELELIQILRGRIFHSEFQDTVGEGLHHIGFAVEDVLADTKKLVDQGAEVVLDQGAGCQYVRFPGDGGIITELYRKHPPYKEDKAR